jgi:hypothetical protein
VRSVSSASVTLPPDQPEEPDEYEDPDELDERLPGSRAAYAVNWKTVLAVDAAMGVVVALGGVILIAAWNFYLGVALTGLGLFYVAMVVRRGRAWARLRADAGM